MRQKAVKELRREAGKVARSRWRKYTASLRDRSFWQRLKFAVAVILGRKEIRL